jgi:uncharacterized protein YjeT (DUF2065 family)
MLLAHIILLTTALVLGIIGIGFLWAPEAWARTIEVGARTPMARTDIRATYGGFVLAAGVCLAVPAFHLEWVTPGLFACGSIYAGFAGGRLLGIVLERQAARLMTFFLVVEVLGAALSFFALARLTS